MRFARAVLLLVTMAAAVAGVAVISPAQAADDFGPLEPLVIETEQAGVSTLHHFMVELADTPDLRTRGLMHRRELAADRGMLFLFPRSERQAMWMKNTYVSLDMLFIDSTGRIIDIAANTRPLSERTIVSSGKARAVLELLAGTAARLGITVGDLVRHRAFEMQTFPSR